MNKRVRRFAPWALLALILFVIGFAFANSNTVPGSYAGDGSGSVSGYAVSNIHYVLDTTNPNKIQTVQFTLTPGSGANAAQVTKILLEPSTSWIQCTTSDSGTTWSCPVAGAVNTVDVTNLRVVAAQ